MSLGLTSSSVLFADNASGSVAWTNVSNLIGGTLSTYATLPSGSPLNSRIYTYDYDLSTISGFEDYRLGVFYIETQVRCKAASTGTGTEKLLVALTMNGTGNFTTPQYFCCNQTSAAIKTNRFYFAPNGQRIRRKDLYNNPAFGISITTPEVWTVDLQVDYVGIKVYYLDNTNDYLKGERSYFPIAADTLTDATNSPNVITSVDNTWVVKARQINLLGDAIYSTEATLLGEGDVVGGLGPGTVYIGVTSVPTGSVAQIITVSTTVTGVFMSLTDPIHYNRFYHLDKITNTAATSSNTNLTSVRHSQVFSLPPSGFSGVKKVRFDYVSGVGWATQGSVVRPIYVDPRVYVSENNVSGFGVYFGFTGIGPDIMSSSSRGVLDNQLPTCTISPPPTGNITVRIFGMGTSYD